MKRMNAITIIFTVIVCLFFSVGCDIPQLRPQPSEPIKRTTQAATDFMQGTSQITPANKEVAKLLRPTRTYVGEPDNPKDMDDLIEAQWSEWETLKKQNSAYKLVANLCVTSTKNIVGQLAVLVEKIKSSEDGKVSVESILPIVNALWVTQDMALDLSDNVIIPPDADTSSDLSKIRDDIRQLVTDANKDAAKKVSGKDVVKEGIRQANVANESAKDITETATNIASDWGIDLTTLGTGGGGLLGMIGLGLRARSKTKKATKVQEEITEQIVQDKDSVISMKDREIARLQGENDGLYVQIRNMTQNLAEAPSILMAQPAVKPTT